MNSQNEQDLVTKSFNNFHIKNTNNNLLSDIILSNQVRKKKGLQGEVMDEKIVNELKNFELNNYNNNAMNFHSDSYFDN